MIRIEQENDQKLFIPKNVEGEPELLQIHSELTQKTISFDVSDLGTSSRYYNFTINAFNVPEGEYNYSVISDEGVELAIGLLTIGDPDTNLVIIQYGDGDINYIQYYPNQKSHISLETDLHLLETADSISYTVQANHNWIFQLYSRHHTSSTWQLISEESHSESTYDGSYFIGENIEDYPKHFKIIVTTTDGLAQEQAEIFQDPHYYMTVDVFSSSSAIPASATELSYGIQYSEYNSVHTGTFFIYRNDELIKEQPFGVYHYGYSTYMEISANTTDQPVTYSIYGILDNGQNDRFEVVQAAAEATDYSKKRFSVEMLEDGYIEWDGVILYYDIIRDGERDEGYQLDHSILGLLEGDVVEFYTKFDNPVSFDNKILRASGKHNVYGNIMSLLYVDFEDVAVIPNNFEFASLFNQNTNLINAENLILPATQLTPYCYHTMFVRCSNLIKAPELPATTLVTECYHQMFDGCTSLTYVKCLATDISATNCTNNWLNRVSATGDFWKMSSAAWTTGVNGIPNGWTAHNIDR